MKGNRLQQLRSGEGLTQAALADFCGVGQRTIERWEKGETGIPDEQKRKLCTRFGVSADRLMGWDRDSEKAVA